MSAHELPQPNCYPLIRELRKLDEALRSGNRNAALIMQASANALEKYEQLKEAVRDLQETLRDGSDSMDVKITVAKLNGILG
jgi:hypothetical protein